MKKAKNYFNLKNQNVFDCTVIIAGTHFFCFYNFS